MRPKDPYRLVMQIPLTVMAIAIMAGVLYYNAVGGGQPAATAQGELEREFHQLAPQTGARQMGYEASHKVGSALVHAEYLATTSYAVARAYYDVELAAHGWRFRA